MWTSSLSIQALSLTVVLCMPGEFMVGLQFQWWCCKRIGRTKWQWSLARFKMYIWTIFVLISRYFTQSITEGASLEKVRKVFRLNFKFYGNVIFQQWHSSFNEWVESNEISYCANTAMKLRVVPVEIKVGLLYVEIKGYARQFVKFGVISVSVSQLQL